MFSTNVTRTIIEAVWARAWRSWEILAGVTLAIVAVATAWSSCQTTGQRAP